MIGFLLPISILPIFAVAYFSFKFSDQALVNHVYEHYTTAAELKMQEIRLWTQDVKGEFALVTDLVLDELQKHQYFEQESESDNGVFENHLGSEERLRALMKEIVLQRPMFTDLFVVEGGTGRVHLASDTSMEEKILLHEPVFTEGQKGIYLEGITFSPSVGASIMRVSAPLNIGSERWVLGGDIDVDALNDILGNFSGLGKTGETYLVNEYYQFIGVSRFLPNKDFISVTSVGANDCLSKNNGKGVYADYRNVSVIGVYRWIPELRVCLLAEIDEAEALGPIVILRRLIFILSFVAITLILTFGSIFSLQLTHPIQLLTAAAKSISAGQVRSKLSKKLFKSKDEVSVLARAFEDMSDRFTVSLEGTKNIIDTMPSPLFTLEQDGTIRSVNPKAVELLGYSEDELIGMPIQKIIKLNI